MAFKIFTVAMQDTSGSSFRWPTVLIIAWQLSSSERIASGSIASPLMISMAGCSTKKSSGCRRRSFNEYPWFNNRVTRYFLFFLHHPIWQFLSADSFLFFIKCEYTISFRFYLIGRNENNKSFASFVPIRFNIL